MTKETEGKAASETKPAFKEVVRRWTTQGGEERECRTIMTPDGDVVEKRHADGSVTVFVGEGESKQGLVFDPGEVPDLITVTARSIQWRKFKMSDPSSRNGHQNGFHLTLTPEEWLSQLPFLEELPVERRAIPGQPDSEPELEQEVWLKVVLPFEAAREFYPDGRCCKLVQPQPYWRYAEERAWTYVQFTHAYSVFYEWYDQDGYHKEEEFRTDEFNPDEGTFQHGMWVPPWLLVPISEDEATDIYKAIDWVYANGLEVPATFANYVILNGVEKSSTSVDWRPASDQNLIPTPGAPEEGDDEESPDDEPVLMAG
ncbi:MAG: hypothetical protein COV29_04270 [Candidatus Yanofskybacteria bacterium CG10_big_fil_rev_8_21_14_0_10_36_16]|uniref:Uncharacterized protein n=1 Tax=Candidatus Yanofskybacteria bacterium CG10_big_fil_rev_8_21_14_0_10_36_16 TaxID=1975096 RepID=A0A2J0Q6D9_9BACT|nr:MAG: hypothetical protein COV29_04270 [Candidatus Yanofskybacteria bacterium CG10_big_fil_rev_8_21_14_0_10_36_16]